MSKCSEKCEEIKQKLDSISKSDSNWVYGSLLALEYNIDALINAIHEYANKEKV